MITVQGEIMTENQITALSKVGRGYDFFSKTIRQALQAGVSPEKIIDFLDSPETRITAAVMRKVIEREIVVPGEAEAELEAASPSSELDEDADTLSNGQRVEDDDTVVITT